MSVAQHYGPCILPADCCCPCTSPSSPSPSPSSCPCLPSPPPPLHPRTPPPLPPPRTPPTKQRTEITELVWTRLGSRGCQLGIRRAEGPTVNFLGFKDKVCVGGGVGVAVEGCQCGEEGARGVRTSAAHLGGCQWWGGVGDT